jgi:dolichol-phosphate mannosyltransferase
LSRNAQLNYYHPETKRKSLSIILPVYNEAKNLEILIPEIDEVFVAKGCISVEVLVVDDNSTDKTEIVLRNLTHEYPYVRHILRTSNPSLPKSIQQGVNEASGQYISWLDADGSMPILDLFRLYTHILAEDLDVCIGSRFIEGGGFKGLNQKRKTNLWQFLSNLKESEDTVLAVILSRALNIFLRFSINAGVRDTTSGFIVIKAKTAREIRIEGIYGDYFPRMLLQFKQNDFAVEELGYFCIPRVYGESKTGKNIISLVKTGIPYLNLGLITLLIKLFRFGKEK